MNQREYERRKQDLDEQLEAGIEILRSAHRTQRNALDLVWMASPENRAGGDFPFARPLVPAAEAAVPSDPPPEPARRRWRPGELRAAVEAVLEKVPAELDRNDLVAALGVEPERGSLYRVVEELCRDGLLEKIDSGRGRSASRYRKLED